MQWIPGGFSPPTRPGYKVKFLLDLFQLYERGEESSGWAVKTDSMRDFPLFKSGLPLTMHFTGLVFSWIGAVSVANWIMRAICVN